MGKLKMKKMVLATKTEVYNEILENSRIEILFLKDEKIFSGALLFKLEQDDKIVKHQKTEIIEYTNENELMEKTIKFYKENAIKVFRTTEESMHHWQYMNGYTNTITAKY